MDKDYNAILSERETENITVVMAVHDQADQLEKNLPLFLDVAGEAGAQVIVVDDMSVDDTPDVLKRMRAEHQNLYTTFLPQSVIINPSRLRLALSVGVKAAKGRYVVFADINRPPVSGEWLTGLADGEAAVVYSNRKKDAVTHVVASELEDLRSLVMKTERKGGRGHRGRWMKQRRGVYDALAVKRERAFDAVNYFDQRVRGWKLAGLRLSTWL
ncbi:MAG: glycosyltransferase [Prevotella sp.]|nr:glycosyltransferase [Prevotella sp.]